MCARLRVKTLRLRLPNIMFLYAVYAVCGLLASIQQCRIYCSDIPTQSVCPSSVHMWTTIKESFLTGKATYIDSIISKLQTHTQTYKVAIIFHKAA